MTTGFLEVKFSKWLQAMAPWQYRLGEQAGVLREDIMIVKTGSQLLIISNRLLNEDKWLDIKLSLTVTILESKPTTVNVLVPELSTVSFQGFTKTVLLNPA